MSIFKSFPYPGFNPAEPDTSVYGGIIYSKRVYNSAINAHKAAA